MDVVESGSGPQALELLEREREFDVAVLDLMMPEMDGIELGAEIRSRLEKQLPLVLLSSVGLQEAREDPRYEAVGFTGYLAKPLKPAALESALQSALGLAGDSGKQAAAPTELDPELGVKHPLRILLTEDNPVNQKLALRLLEKMGYRADVAGNGIEAIEAVERQTYDLVLMDVQMPEMDGLEATRQIVARWPDARPRIVAMTADAMQGDRERCLDAGMDEYLTKPIRTSELVGALRRVRPFVPAEEEGPELVDAKALETLVQSMGGDHEFVVELLQTFASDAPRLLEQLRNGVASGDADAVRRAAHTLRSSAATFGAPRLSTLCAELEAQAKNGTLDRGVELVSRIETAYAQTSSRLDEARAVLSGA
jgi:CheY-like chemotaxis protein